MIQQFNYGIKFQQKLISSILTDLTFFGQYFDLIEHKYFESEALITIYQLIKAYFLSYKTLPTVDILEVLISDISNEVIRESAIQQLSIILSMCTDKDLQFIKDKAVMFCKNQKLKEAIIKSTELMTELKYDSIRSIIDEALRVGDKRSTYTDYVENFEKRYAENERKTIETPWSIINELFNGGLGRRELGVITASAGVGKSWLLTAIGAYAISIGKKVLHIGLELTEEYTLQRYDAVLTGIPFCELTYNKEDVYKKIKKYADLLKTQNFPPESITTTTIRSTIQLLKARGFNPDLVIVDYAGLMREEFVGGVKSNNTYLEKGKVYVQLRALASEFDIPVWTADQLNRSAAESEEVNSTMISDSFKKIMHADFIIGISRTDVDKVQGTARVKIIKSRQGQDGLVFTANFNANIGKMEIYAPNTDNHFEAKKKMDEKEIVNRKILKQKIAELNYKEKDVQ